MAVLGLFFVSHPEHVRGVNSVLWFSDHNLLNKCRTLSVPKLKKMKTIWNYPRANTDMINAGLVDSFPVFELLYERRSVEGNWRTFKNYLIIPVNQYVPKKRIYCNESSPWFNSSLEAIEQEKKIVTGG